MTGRRRYSGLVVRPALTCAILTLLFLTSAFAQPIGKTGAVEGSPEIMASGQTKYQPLKKGGPVSVGDTVSAPSQAKVWIRVDDRSDNSLGEMSSLIPNDFGEEGPATFYQVHVPEGSVRFIKKLDKTSPPSSYTVTTPTAVISVEPGDEAADFVVQAPSAAQSSVTVIGGSVRVRNIVEEISTERLVRSCQMSEIYQKKEPTKPTGVSSDTLRYLVDLTTIPNTLPEDVPECEPVVKEYPPPRPCPCPWGMAEDPVDGECKPCAFWAGAFYDPSTCTCRCGPGPGYFEPITGTWIGNCPTQVPLVAPGIVPPDPDVLPHEGCPRCECCPSDAGCFTSTPNDGSCTEPRCGQCAPGQALPAAPGTDYPCPKCCECDLGGNPLDPCGINAAGFPVVTPCGAGIFPGKCIAQSDCQANGGFFVQTSGIPGWPCWICQKDAPLPYLAAMKKSDCGPCKRKVWRNGKPKCVPEPDHTLCYFKGKCRECVKGKCEELPPCPPDQERDSRCKCVEKPKPKCSSNEECRKSTKGAKPCCKNGECVKMKRCPDGGYHCECVPPPPPPPPPPGPTPVVHCTSDSHCRQRHGEGRGCCVDGRCVPPHKCPDGSVACRCESAQCMSEHDCRRKYGNRRPCCVEGVCKPRQQCRDETWRCSCEHPPPPTHCRSESDCRRKYGNSKPCCVQGECRPKKRCPDESWRCTCEHPTPDVCRSESDCRRKYGRGRSCCIGDECRSLQRCPDGSMRCRCDSHPTSCGRCEVRYSDGRCRSCDSIGKVCDRRSGRCVSPGHPDDPCRKCYRAGKDCDKRTGRCVDKGGGHQDPCQKCYRAGKDCDKRTGRCIDKGGGHQDPCQKCYRAGKSCVNGRCVDRPKPPPHRQLQPRGGLISPGSPGEQRLM
jgi:hypothetical protein